MKKGRLTEAQIAPAQRDANYTPMSQFSHNTSLLSPSLPHMLLIMKGTDKLARLWSIARGI